MKAWALEEAELFDSEESWARSEGEYGYACFCQNIARALRLGVLDYEHIRRDERLVMVVGGFGRFTESREV